ncbi:trypsin-1-like [Culicoides brevitarsis]|uniref:trypsin-1-like n=1 Tax=Culicoides brevitarsis TaxID=469753 RepID=UPI00307BC05C
MLRIISIILIYELITAQGNSPKLYTSPEMNPFVVGGNDVKIENYPFVVACYNYGYFTCGGSIVSKNYVLTAGHCTVDDIQYNVTERQEYGPNMIAVAKNIRHPNYQDYRKYDVQLLLLAEDIPIGEPGIVAVPVKFPRPYYEVKGDSYVTGAQVLGWGYTEDYIIPYKLQCGKYYVVNNTYCEWLHQGVANVYDSNCCNGVIGGGIADCNGDSGGPIVLDVNGQLVQYCIVSWSVKPCENPTYPAVGTKTSHYVEWISQETNIPIDELTVDIETVAFH